MLGNFIKTSGDENQNEYYQSNKYLFNYIADFPSIANKNRQPSFLFAHMNCPHLPYVFDRNGDYCENPTNYFEYETLDNKVLKSLYLEQYLFVTNRMKDVINKILKKSETEPVIIILSDHGPRAVSAGIENIVQHHRVLNAVYFPGRDYKGLYDTIAPVNTIRIVLNKYFGTHYSMLEDR